MLNTAWEAWYTHLLTAGVNVRTAHEIAWSSPWPWQITIFFSWCAILLNWLMLLVFCALGIKTATTLCHYDGMCWILTAVLMRIHKIIRTQGQFLRSVLEEHSIWAWCWGFPCFFVFFKKYIVVLPSEMLLKFLIGGFQLPTLLVLQQLSGMFEGILEKTGSIFLSLLSFCACESTVPYIGCQASASPPPTPPSVPLFPLPSTFPSFSGAVREACPSPVTTARNWLPWSALPAFSWLLGPLPQNVPERDVEMLTKPEQPTSMVKTEVCYTPTIGTCWWHKGTLSCNTIMIQNTFPTQQRTLSDPPSFSILFLLGLCHTCE